MTLPRQKKASSATRLVRVSVSQTCFLDRTLPVYPNELHVLDDPDEALRLNQMSSGMHILSN
jgi:hypothetical protein